MRLGVIKKSTVGSVSELVISEIFGFESGLVSLLAALSVEHSLAVGAGVVVAGFFIGRFGQLGGFDALADAGFSLLSESGVIVDISAAHLK